MAKVDDCRSIVEIYESLRCRMQYIPHQSKLITYEVEYLVGIWTPNFKCLGLRLEWLVFLTIINYH